MPPDPGRHIGRRRMTMPFPKQSIWVLVADGTRARILASGGPGRGLHPVPGQEFAVEIPPTHEIGSDRPGRAFESASPTRHAIEPRVDRHRFEKERFAHEIAKVLDQAAQSGTFAHLVLVAPPQALGDLRAALDERTRALIAGEINKDLTAHDDREIAAQIRERFPIPL